MFYYYLLFILLQTSENPILMWGDKITLVGGLLLMLCYFMNQFKAMQSKYETALKDAKTESESTRKLYEDKVDKLLEKYAQSTERMMININENTNSNKQLVQVITDLQKTLLK